MHIINGYVEADQNVLLSLIRLGFDREIRASLRHWSVNGAFKSHRQVFFASGKWGVGKHNGYYSMPPASRRLWVQGQVLLPRATRADRRPLLVRLALEARRR